MQLFAAGRDAQSAGAARGGQRRLECPRCELDAIRWQLSDSVRHDRAREVDWLAASTAKRELSKARHAFRYSNDVCRSSIPQLPGPRANTRGQDSRSPDSLT
jgi:hypothetical protein